MQRARTPEILGAIDAVGWGALSESAWQGIEIELAVLNGYTVTEVAAWLGVTRRTVTRRRVALRREMSAFTVAAAR